MKYFALIFVVFQLFIGFTQEKKCNLQFEGYVRDKISKKEISFSTIKFLDKIGTTDSLGYFKFSGLCAGFYEVEAYHYENEKPVKISFNLINDTLIFIEVEECFHEIGEVLVEGHKINKQEVETLQKNSLSGAELDKLRGNSLGESLKAITGVNSIQTGPTISKPMIHGVYGNRILILNNGVRLEGQNWGSDHAPEIDPFVATKLSVVKGAASIRYGMDAIAGVVLVEPKELPSKKSMNGELNLVGSSNGKSGIASGTIEGAFGKKFEGLAYRIQGTMKTSGSYSTPNYYLTNTGMNEKNYSAAINYRKEKWNLESYYSNFDSKLGIYSGSYVGNLTDLYAVFNSKQPLVPSIFSYSIERGYQTANHQLFKLKGEYNFSKLSKLIYTYSRQINKRSEFGQDLSYNDEIVAKNIPDAYFKLATDLSELIWEHSSIGHLNGCLGAQFETQGNIYEGLDYRALIPNYRNYSGGAFLLEKIHFGKWSFEGGIRYDYKWMKTYSLDFTTLQKKSQLMDWQNASGSLGTIYRINSKSTINLSSSVGWRPPSPIELFANGIHQSAASFEIGDSTLKTEKSLTIQSFYTYNTKKTFLEIGGYYNYYSDYIYLNPMSKPIVTIAGTYPGFEYRQANVYYYGLDLNFSTDLGKRIEVSTKNSLVYAYNLTIKDYLINVPSNRYQLALKYSIDKIFKVKSIFFQLGTSFIDKQYRTPKNVDYVAAPNAYFLMNFDLGFVVPIKNQSITFNLVVDNLLNTTYRDYLNRFRYYSDELGRNISLKIKVPFNIIQAK